MKPSSLVCMPLALTVALVLLVSGLQSCVKDKEQTKPPGRTESAPPSAVPSNPEAKRSKRQLRKDMQRSEGASRKKMKRSAKRRSRKVRSFAPPSPSMGADDAPSGNTPNSREAITKWRESIEKEEQKLQRMSPSGTRVKYNSPKAKKVCTSAQTICKLAKKVCKLTRAYSLSMNDCRETRASCRRAGKKCPDSLKKSFEIDM
ncbi:MAG: hypothetical protein EP343_25760 [Deltaproteobacteria bacterium]|nr:MAG: hypothetical protein EP343_25760 [Deltaproteobacteria bacterium]